MLRVPKHLLEERDRLIAQWARLSDQAEAIANKIKGLELAIDLLEKGDAEESAVSEPEAASNIKVLLLELAQEAKAEGLNANIAVVMASKRGIALKRGTAASNLSRLKNDGVLVHDGRRYRLPEFIRGKIFAVGDPNQPTPVGMQEVVPGTPGLWRNKAS